jgi:transcriptional regulator with XRE-family HTH domain
MLAIKGHSVPLVNAYLSKAFQNRFGHYWRMREVMTPAEFVAMYIARTKALRMHAGMTAQQMATALGVPFERYKKYESRTALPHELVEQFALIARVPIEFVMTGRRTGPGPYPDVPGPHMLEQWRADLASGDADAKKGRPKKNN